MTNAFLFWYKFLGMENKNLQLEAGTVFSGLEPWCQRIVWEKYCNDRIDEKKLVEILKVPVAKITKFLASLDFREAYREVMLEQKSGLMKKALSVVESCLDSEDEKIRYNAAVVLLEDGGILKRKAPMKIVERTETNVYNTQINEVRKMNDDQLTAEIKRLGNLGGGKTKSG
mgnify:CR=1 FL=1